MGWLPEIGDVVLGKYRVIRALGQGGMGVVFEAVNVATDGRVALKMLKPALESGSERTSRMAREARAAAKLRSRFVARVIDFDHTSDGAPVLVMELLEGRDLSAELRGNKTLAIDDALSYVIQACAGVAEAHALGIIHRDLKPGNLFLDASAGGPPIVRVLDFGLSKQLEADGGAELTSPSEALGTLAYMSPEQVRATKHVDARTDVWALGVILYRVLTGKLPLSEKGYAIATRLLDARPMPRVEREGVPRELAAVVAQALEKEQARRVPDARALGKMLVPFVLRPSPATKLAFDELDAMPSARAVMPSMAPPRDDDATEASTTRTAITADTLPDERTLRARPPRRRRATLGINKRETQYLLAGSLVLGFSALLLAATSVPRRAAEPPPAPSPAVVAAPPPAQAPHSPPAPILILPPARTIAPSASVAPPPPPRPRPRPAPPVSPRLLSEPL